MGFSLRCLPHPPLRPFNDPLWHQAFRRIYELRRHVRSAHGNTVFECDLCGTRFSRQDALHRHKKRSATKPCTATHKSGAGTSRLTSEDEHQSGAEDTVSLSEDNKGTSTPARENASADGAASPAAPHHVAEYRLPAVSFVTGPQSAGQFQHFPAPGLGEVDPLLLPYPLVKTTSRPPPTALQVPIAVLEALVDQHAEFNGPITFFHHIPTFKQHVQEGVANHTELLAILWSALTVVERPSDSTGLQEPWIHVLSKEYQRTVVKECMAAVQRDYEAVIRDSANLNVADVRAVMALAARATAALKAIVIARMCAISEMQTLPLDTFSKFDNMVISLFRLARFGQLPYDVADQQRDTMNPGAWIWNEERARLLTMIFIVDCVSADAWKGGVPHFLHSAEHRVSFDAQRARYSPDWANVSIPCPDMAFDRLPPAPLNMQQLEDWLKWDEASGGVLASVEPRPHGDAYTWMDLPREDPRRIELLKILSGGILRRGYMANMTSQADFYSRFLVCKNYFADHGYKLYAPPTGTTEAEVTAMRTREKLMQGIEDWCEMMPTDVKNAFEDSDGQLLKTEAARWWGKSRRRLLAHAFAYLNSFKLVLNSPYDILEQYGDPVPDDEWPFSRSFVLAESAAIGISRLVKSYIEPKYTPFIDLPAPSPPWDKSSSSTKSGSGSLDRPGPGPALPLPFSGPLNSGLNEEDLARYRRDEFRRVPPFWANVVLRACWVHVIGMRKLRACLLSERIATDAEMLRSTLETVRSLVSDIESALEGMQDSVWQHTAAAYRIIRSWAEREVAEENDGDRDRAIWVGPTAEEMELIRGRGRS